MLGVEEARVGGRADIKKALVYYAEDLDVIWVMRSQGKVWCRDKVC